MKSRRTTLPGFVISRPTDDCMTLLALCALGERSAPCALGNTRGDPEEAQHIARPGDGTIKSGVT